MSVASFSIKQRYAAQIRWSKRGTCGERGCTDPECGCSLCGEPIGVPDDDPRWDDHDEWCSRLHDLETAHLKLLAALQPFVGALAVIDAHREAQHISDQDSLVDHLPLGWPSVGDLRKLVKAAQKKKGV